MTRLTPAQLRNAVQSGRVSIVVPNVQTEVYAPASVALTLPVPPSNNHYKRHVCTRSTRDDVHQVTAYVTPEAEGFYLTVANAVTLAGSPTMGGDVGVRLDVYRRTRRGDADNFAKCGLDAMQACGLLHNDSQVKELHIHLYKDAQKPRMEVTVWRLIVRATYVTDNLIEKGS